MKLRFHPLSLLLGLSLLLSPIHFTAPKAEESKAHVEEPEDAPSTTTLMGSGHDAKSALEAAGLDISYKPPLAWSCTTTKGQDFNIKQSMTSGGIVMVQWMTPGTTTILGTQVYNASPGAMFDQEVDLPVGTKEVHIYTCTDDITELRMNAQQMTALDVGALSKLELLFAAGNLIFGPQDLSNNTELIECHFAANQLTTNNITSLNVTGLTDLTTLIAYDNLISSPMDLRSCQSLVNCQLYNNQIPLLDVKNLSNLMYLNARNNQIDGVVDIRGCNSITNLIIDHNDIDYLYFDVSGNNPTHSSLVEIQAAGNEISNPQDLRGCSSLVTCNYSTHNTRTNLLPSLNVEGLSSLNSLRADGDGTLNPISNSMDLTGCLSLKTCIIGNNKIPSLNIAGLPLLQTLHANNNLLDGTIDFSGCKDIADINLAGNLIDALIFDPAGSTTTHPDLTDLWVQGNTIANHQDLTGCSGLLRCYYSTHQQKNTIPSIDVSGLANLVSLRADQNQIGVNNSPSTIDVSSCTNLKDLIVNSNQITAISLPTSSQLDDVYINSNSFSQGSLDSFAQAMLALISSGQAAASGNLAVQGSTQTNVIADPSAAKTALDDIALNYSWTVTQQ